MKIQLPKSQKKGQIHLFIYLFTILKATLHKKMSHTTYVGAEAKKDVKLHLKEESKQFKMQNNNNNNKYAE